MSRALSVTTNTSSQIVIQTGDYAAGAGDKYSFYSASSTSAGANTLGEAGVAEWYHGTAGFRSTTTTTSTSTQASPGWDASNADGGFFNWDIENTVACTGTGSAFSVANASNTVFQSVHLRGATSSSKVEKFWNIWANGTHAVASKFSQAVANGGAFGVCAARSSYVSSTVQPSTFNMNGGFAGTHIGVLQGVSQPGANLWSGGGGTGTGSDGSGYTEYFTTSTPISAGTIQNARLAVDGYEGVGVVTNALVTAFVNDYNHHGGASNTLTVTTGTKTTSGTDLFGTTSTSWTDGYDPERGAYVLAASSNHVNLGGGTASAWGIDGTTVTARFSPCFIITGWTDTGSPKVVYNGNTLVSDTDYVAYVDTTNSVLYLCLLSDIGTGGHRTSANISGVGALDIAVSSTSQSWSGSGSVTQSPTITASRLGLYSRSQSSSVAPSPMLQRLMIMLRSQSATGLPTVASTRSQGFPRSLALSLTPTLVDARQLGLERGSSAALEPAAAANRATALARTIGVTMATGTGALRALVMGRLTNLLVTSASTASILHGLVRSVSVTLAPIIQNSRATTLLRLGSSMIATTPLGAHVTNIIRTVIVTMSPASGVARALIALRAAGSALTTTSAASYSLQSAGAFFLSAGTTIVTTTSAARSLAASRVWSVTETLTVQATRLVANARTGAITLPMSLSSSRAVQAGRTIGVTLVPAAAGLIQKGLVRAGTALVAPAALTSRTINSLRATGAQIIAVTSATGSGSFSLPLVQIAAWAASRARKGIEELVLAYQSIQSRLGHTQDTQANFDTGFAEFSGETVAPPDFPDPTPGVPQLALPLDLWVAARLAPGNYDLITSFATAQRLVHNLQASFASYDSLYATFVASQEKVPWPH